MSVHKVASFSLKMDDLRHKIESRGQDHELAPGLRLQEQQHAATQTHYWQLSAEVGHTRFELVCRMPKEYAAKSNTDEPERTAKRKHTHDKKARGQKGTSLFELSDSDESDKSDG